MCVLSDCECLPQAFYYQLHPVGCNVHILSGSTGPHDREKELGRCWVCLKQTEVSGCLSFFYFFSPKETPTKLCCPGSHKTPIRPCFIICHILYKFIQLSFFNTSSYMWNCPSCMNVVHVSISIDILTSDPLILHGRLPMFFVN